MLVAMYDLSGSRVLYIELSLIAAIILVDIWALIRGPASLSVVTGVGVFAAALISHFVLLPTYARRMLPYLFFLILLGTALFLNEAWNCRAMMEWMVYMQSWRWWSWHSYSCSR